MPADYDGYTWAELYRFQTQTVPDAVDPTYWQRFRRMPLEVRLLDIAGMLTRDVGHFAIRAVQLQHASQGLPFGTEDRERTLAEMRCALGWLLGHLIDAAAQLEADVVGEFAAWSAEIGVQLPPRPAD
ncbi:MAG: hypothetical protein IMW98_01925 [Firmicutes bacterium]|nr:hypothetical protein [Bacillota bacterium]